MNLIGVLHLLVRPGNSDADGDDDDEGANDAAAAAVEDDDDDDEDGVALLIGSSFIISCCCLISTTTSDERLVFITLFTGGMDGIELSFLIKLFLFGEIISLLIISFFF